jgi:type II secretory pathway component PulF
MTTARRSRLFDFALLAAACLIALGGAALLVWLLWRWVPLHAALFAGLTVDVPRNTQLVMAASKWFVRLVPLLIILVLVLASLVARPLFLRMTGASDRWAVRALAGILSLVALLELGASAFVVREIRAGCSSGSADSRFREELASFRTAGESPCSTWQAE